MAGKRAVHLELQDPADREKLKKLIAEADVIIQGYRLRSLERHGFGQPLALALADARQRGVVYLDENCFGPDGYYAERPGWQQVADAAAGSEYVLGKAYGFREGTGVLPSLPISDMCTGTLAAITCLSMLRDRSKFGGSWSGCASLTALNMATLEPWVERFHYEPMTPDIHVIELYYAIVDAWDKYAARTGELTANEDFYAHFADSVYGKDLRILAPVVKYPNDGDSAFKWTSPPVPFCFHKVAEWGAKE
jgi:crotonobetainyl-CoA:carnitine CoA-transferase CaiB-like acyl-CoA transferase